MDDDSPTTGDPIADALAKALRWLHQQADQLFPQPHEAARPAPADMTDKQLQQDIHNVGGNLLNGHGPMIMSGFARYGTATTDPRFKHAMPTTVRGHLLNMTADANDSYGLALRGLNKHAHASALGAIRNVAETLRQTSWLLEDPDDRVRQARAYRLTLNAINQYHLMTKTLRRVTKDSEQPSDLATQLDAAEERMRRSLTAITERDGIAQCPTNAGKPSKLIERYLPEHGGFMLYALLSKRRRPPRRGPRLPLLRTTWNRRLRLRLPGQPPRPRLLDRPEHQALPRPRPPRRTHPRLARLGRDREHRRNQPSAPSRRSRTPVHRTDVPGHGRRRQAQLKPTSRQRRLGRRSITTHGDRKLNERSPSDPSEPTIHSSRYQVRRPPSRRPREQAHHRVDHPALTRPPHPRGRAPTRCARATGGPAGRDPDTRPP